MKMNQRNKFFDFSGFTHIVKAHFWFLGSVMEVMDTLSIGICDFQGHLCGEEKNERDTLTLNRLPSWITAFHLGSRRSWPQTNHEGSWESDKSLQIIGWALRHSADRTTHQSIIYKWANRRGKWRAKTSGKGADAWILPALPGNGVITPLTPSRSRPEVQKEHVLCKTLTGHRIKV